MTSLTQAFEPEQISAGRQFNFQLHQAASTMSDTAHVREKTFRNYDKAKGNYYAENRMAYHPSVYATIIEHHTATGGHLDNVLDLGCGPGLATGELAGHFNHATGLDPSEGMLDAARSLNLKTSTGEPVRFELSSAEDMAGLEDESIDLITAANAAHWFDMPSFWRRAAQVLKPGGSVALWTSGSPAVHPDTPNAAAINSAWQKHRDEHLLPYFEPGNLLTRQGYRTLKMPWDVSPAMESFSRESLFRKDWELSRPFHAGQDRLISLDMLERMLATGSPETRWREAHPDAVGTEKDVVRMLRREIERLLSEVGVSEGDAALRGATPGVVLMVKKVAGETG
ncbi:hypothetical protein Q7P37_008220 [Cladosporium fusiforme]